MTNWIDTLTQFSNAIRTGTGFAPNEIISPHYAAARGIEVYRNNYRGNLHDTLANAYPVICQLVGEPFFRLLAKRYIELHPSRSGNLHRYGGEMANFLTQFENTQHLVYLPDIARLEWAYHLAYFAADAPPFDIARLGTVAPEAYKDLKWRLHPSCALLISAYPVAAIWQAHQAGEPDVFHINLSSGSNILMVYRDGMSVQIFSLEPSSHYWLSQLQNGIAMGQATNATLSAYPDFDLANTLRHWLARGVLIDFHI